MQRMGGGVQKTEKKLKGKKVRRRGKQAPPGEWYLNKKSIKREGLTRKDKREK